MVAGKTFQHNSPVKKFAGRAHCPECISQSARYGRQSADFLGCHYMMYLDSLVLLILNLPLIPYVAKVFTAPRSFLIPLILFSHFTLMSTYIG